MWSIHKDMRWLSHRVPHSRYFATAIFSVPLQFSSFQRMISDWCALKLKYGHIKLGFTCDVKIQVLVQISMIQWSWRWGFETLDLLHFFHLQYKQHLHNSLFKCLFLLYCVYSPCWQAQLDLLKAWLGWSNSYVSWCSVNYIE